MKKDLTVAMLSHGYYPRIGGAERQLAALTPTLMARGVDVRVFTRRDPGLPSREKIRGVPVRRLPVPGPKPLASLVFTLGALAELRRLRPDIVHAHELFSPGTTALFAKTLLGMPIVVTAHRSGAIGDVKRLKRKLLGTRRLDWFRRHVDAFVVISKDIEKELLDVDIEPQRLSCIPNGVDTDHFSPASPEEKRSLRQKLDLPAAPVALFSGRLVPEKGIADLLKIWPQVRAVHSRATLLLLGAGSEEHSLRRAAGEGVRFLGGVEEVVPFLRAADVFVLPSVAEGLSVATLEALAVGLAAVVTDVGGASDIVIHGQTGWLVPPAEPDALRNGLLQLFGDEHLRAELGQRGREHVLSGFGLVTISEHLHHLYLKLVRKRCSSRQSSL